MIGLSRLQNQEYQFEAMFVVGWMKGGHPEKDWIRIHGLPTLKKCFWNF